MRPICSPAIYINAVAFLSSDKYVRCDIDNSTYFYDIWTVEYLVRAVPFILQFMIPFPEMAMRFAAYGAEENVPLLLPLLCSLLICRIPLESPEHERPNPLS
jgi:hypothetical protein